MPHPFLCVKNAFFHFFYRLTAQVLAVQRDTQEEEANKYTHENEEKRRRDEAERQQTACNLRLQRSQQQKSCDASTADATAAIHSLRTAPTSSKSLFPQALLTSLTALTCKKYFFKFYFYYYFFYI